MSRSETLAAALAVLMLTSTAAAGASAAPAALPEPIDTVANAPRISLWHGSFDPLSTSLPIPDGFSAVAGHETSYHLVQLAGPVKREWREALESRGIVVTYVPTYSFLMRLDSPLASLRSLDFVRAVSPMQPHFKVHPGLLGVAGEQRLLVDVYPWESERTVVDTVLRAGGRLEAVERSPWHTTLLLRVQPSLIPLIAMHDEVRWVQMYDDPVILNGEAQWVVQSGIQGSRPIWNRSLRGEGQYVAYADTGLDYDHSFFRDGNMSQPGKGHRKVVSYRIWEAPAGDQHNHGTHVAGSIAGNDRPTGGSSPNIGEAPAALLHVDDAGTGSLAGLPKDLNNLFIVSHNSTNSTSGEGARIHSNSWGWPSEHNYTQAAATSDEFMWNHKDFLVVIAAGNERSSGVNSLRSPGLAKNVVTVGATQNGLLAGDMATFSSIGPTQGDGRLKPTICAPGVNIRSALNDRDLTTNNSGETQMSGTSMATPTTSGTLALVRQYFTEGWYPSGTKSGSDSLTPSAALMKSVLMAGAVEITGAGSDFKNEGVYPNNSQGWGRVTLENSLYFSGDAGRLWIKDERGGVQTGDNVTFKVQVKSAGVPLKLILVWTDAPGAIYSNPSIVNDLDLMVTGPNGTYFGNRFAGKNPGHSVKGGSFDRVNVEEGVILPDAANGLIPGEYTINVIGQNVPTGPQPFALVVVGDIEGQASVASVTIAPTTASVEVAKSAQFQARALDAAGNDVPGASFAYAVAPATLGTATDLGNGSVTFTAATSTGTGVLTATASGKTANASITVISGPIATLTIDPPTISIMVNATVTVRAVGKDQYGNDATPSSISWAVSAGINATVSGSTANETLVAGTKSGTGELTASATGKSAKASVTILPGPAKRLEVPQKIEAVAGTTVDVSARILDEYGNEIAGATADWATASGLGTFSPSTGLSVKFQAGTKAGKSSFSVISGPLSEVRDLIVVPGPAKTLEVPRKIEAVAGTTVDASARVLDEFGNEITAATPIWATASGLGTFSPTAGLDVRFNAGTQAGDGTFIVTLTGISATGELRVVPGPPAKITISPGHVTLVPQGSAEVTATVFDQYDNLIENATVSWEPPGFATLNFTAGKRVTISSGAIGGAEGTLYARVGSVQASVPVTVSGFWAPDAFLRGGLSTMLFFLILLALVGGILAAAFLVRRRKYANCPRCSSRNQRSSILCSACGATLETGPGSPPAAPLQQVPLGPQDGGSWQQGPPPGAPGEAPPPPDDWRQGASLPGGPGFDPAPPLGGPYQPPPP